MPRKLLNTRLQREIAELVSTGLDVKQALRKLGSPVMPNTVYKAQTKDKEFAELMQDAYFAHFMCIQSELDELSLMTASEVYPNLDFREAAEALKRRTGVMQRKIDNLGPILTAKMNKNTKIEHTGTVSTGITILLDDYSAKPIDVTPTTVEHK